MIDIYHLKARVAQLEEDIYKTKGMLAVAQSTVNKAQDNLKKQKEMIEQIEFYAEEWRRDHK